MVIKFYHPTKCSAMVVMLTLLMACNQDNSIMKKGTYGYDVQFLEQRKVDYLELSGQDGLSRIIIVPAWQGRIMTSTADGAEGSSYGWINYDFIREGKISDQFNVFGGEERFWIGPEGGQYSIYFKEGDPQVFENWQVPAFIDTQAWPVTGQSDHSVSMEATAALKNASGTTFNVKVNRTVTLLGKDEIQDYLGLTLTKNLKMTAYQSDNLLTNIGPEAWTREGGLLSVWMLGMFTPSPQITVFLPCDNSPGMDDIPLVNDEYFGMVPPERLKLAGDVIYFKIDGRYRSKIGIPKERAGEFCGSYDAANNLLTVLWYNKPDTACVYVNSNWGEQEDPYNGDVVNSYNDGPLEDGSIMGPFYEIETSSPGAELSSGESLLHMQRVYHFEGGEDELDPIVQKLFGLSIAWITAKFKSSDQ